jgi:hypothetical protein
VLDAQPQNRLAAADHEPTGWSTGRRRDKRLSLCVSTGEREQLRRLSTHLGESQTATILRAIRELSDREGVPHSAPAAKLRVSTRVFHLELNNEDRLALCRVASWLGTWSCSKALRQLIRNADTQREREQSWHACTG